MFAEMKNRILIVCYSYSGNTYRIAKEIRRQTDGILHEIYPRQPYSMGYQTILEKVRKEIRTGFHPRLLPLPIDISGYDIIFAGTPNWCGTIAPPLASWLAGHNLEGKTVIPFWSHCGQGDRNHIERDIRKLCPKSKLKGEFRIINDGGQELPDEISQWLDKLNISSGKGREKENEVYCVR